MSALFGIENGIIIFEENGDNGISIIRGVDAPGLGQREIDANPGSIYFRENGDTYTKKLSGSGTDKWIRQVTLDDLNGIKPRSENIIAGSGDAAPTSGTAFQLPFSDDDSPQLDSSSFQVGDYVLFGIGGTPKLMKVTAIDSGNDTITVEDAEHTLADGDYMIVKSYLPDSPDDQEKQAMVQYSDGAIVKIGDFNWNFADGIGLASGYAATTGDISASDTVQSAIQKLDGNNDSQDSVLGTAQGATNLGTFTGNIISDNTSVKTALQELESEADSIRILTGTNLGDENLGTFTGNIISDNADIKTALQELETSVEDINVQRKLTNITTEVTLDEVLVDNFHATKWILTASLDSDPSRIKAYEIFAVHNGSNGNDASSVDIDKYARLHIGIPFGVNIGVDLDGSGSAQKMRLRVSAPNGITARVRRLGVDF